MLNSLRWHNQTAVINIHFLHGPELSPKKRRLFAVMAEKLEFTLHWYEVKDEDVSGLPQNVAHISKVVWYRLFMPQLLQKLDRVLYLDCDVLVMDTITPLWQTSLGNHYFAAVTNVVPDYFSHRAAELGLPGPEHYFNLGIAIWNLEIMRRENFTQRVLEYSRTHAPRLLWMEQDSINALYWNRRLRLHPRWNCQNGIYYSSWGIELLKKNEANEAIKEPALIHFEGGSFAKPWHFLSTHPLRDVYFFHRRKTPWPFVLPDGVTPKNIAKRYLPEAAINIINRVRDTARRVLRKIEK